MHAKNTVHGDLKGVSAPLYSNIATQITSPTYSFQIKVELFSATLVSRVSLRMSLPLAILPLAPEVQTTGRHQNYSLNICPIQLYTIKSVPKRPMYGPLDVRPMRLAYTRAWVLLTSHAIYVAPHRDIPLF